MARILIIDDEPDIIDLYRMALTAGGHEIVGTYHNAEEPLERSWGDSQPDLIILDENLGGRSGMASISRFLSLLPAVKIIMLSAEPRAKTWALHLGAHAVKTKPLSMSNLIEEIYHLLNPPSP